MAGRWWADSGGKEAVDPAQPLPPAASSGTGSGPLGHSTFSNRSMTVRALVQVSGRISG